MPFADSMSVLLRNLMALIAHALLRDPRRAPLIGLLCSRLNRAGQRLTALMARIAAGHTPRPARKPAARPTQTPPIALRPRLPSRKAWLLHAMQANPLRHEAACIASALDHLLSQPGIADLLAAHPAAQRILNPIRHFLGLPTTRKPRPPRNVPQPGAPQPGALQPRAPRLHKPGSSKPRPPSWTKILAAESAARLGKKST